MATLLRRLAGAELLVTAVAAIVIGLLAVDVLRALAGIVVQLVAGESPPGYRDAFAGAPFTFEVAGRIVHYGGLLTSALALALAIGAWLVAVRLVARLMRAR